MGRGFFSLWGDLVYTGRKGWTHGEFSKTMPDTDTHRLAFLEEALARGQTLHHGYALVGDRAESRRRLERFLNESLSFSTVGNPDFHNFDAAALAIDDSRMIREAALRRSFGERSIFIISFDALTREAGNALLKTLEEPAPNVHFFIIIPSAETLLPTLRSRLAILNVGGGAAGASSPEEEKRAEVFMRAALPERLAIVRALREENERGEGGESSTREFLAQMERYVHASLPFGGDAIALTAFLLVRRYATDRGASEKLLLEHLAVALPRKVE